MQHLAQRPTHSGLREEGSSPLIMEILILSVLTEARVLINESAEYAEPK
jgi:hypothetical protein